MLVVPRSAAESGRFGRVIRGKDRHFRLVGRSHPPAFQFEVKFLILKPSSLGDVVQALPVLRHLRRHHPGAQIYWWLARDLVPLLVGDEDLTGIFTFDRRRFANPWHWKEVVRDLTEARAQHFDVVLDLQGLLRSGLAAWLARGALTIGIENRREAGFAFYDIAIPRPSPSTHAVDWYLSVLSHLGVPHSGEFDWLPEHPTAAFRAREWMPPGEGPWIVCHPGARWTNKRWPIGHYTRTIELLSRSGPPGARFVILGASTDHSMGMALGKAAPGRVLDLTGRTTLPEMVECLRLADVMITNDTGPMHVAAALNKPVVGMFGPTDPRRTGPYRQSDSVLTETLRCAPCMKSTCHFDEPRACLERLAPERVVREVQARLAHHNVE